MHSKALQDVNGGLLTNVRFYDFPNMAGLLTTYILNNPKIHNNMLKNGKYITHVMSESFHKLENFLCSSFFEKLVNDIKEPHYLSYLHNMTYINRIFVKYQTDLMEGRQISHTLLKSLLPYDENEFIVQDRIKKYHKYNGNSYPIYCDIDFLFIHALIELLYYCQYNENFIQYLVIGSGDKDYSEICCLAKKLGIVIVTVSFRGEGLSHDMEQLSDIVVILHPHIILRKPYIKNIDHLVS